MTLIRDGVEVHNIHNSTYDFDYQTNYMFSEPVEVRPGDAIRASCIYDTSKTTEWTYGGDYSEMEMCIIR